MEPLSGRKSLTDEVHDRLVDALCSGALPPGTPLRQEALAEELNVSRQPVLQALGLLRRDGLVEPMGRRGYRVAPVDGKLVRHVYDLREAFDGLAARLAAETKLWAAATPQTLLQPTSHSIKRSTVCRATPCCPKHQRQSGFRSDA
jgi:DNA-binding GntR family transcriptional regulator